jgi:hypothetical protein
MKDFTNCDFCLFVCLSGLRNCHLGYSQAPERRASFVNIFQTRNNLYNNNLAAHLAIRRKSEINPVSIRSSNDPMTTSIPTKPLLTSRRTSLQIPSLAISGKFEFNFQLVQKLFFFASFLLIFVVPHLAIFISVFSFNRLHSSSMSVPGFEPTASW